MEGVEVERGNAEASGAGEGGGRGEGVGRGGGVAVEENLFEFLKVDGDFGVIVVVAFVVFVFRVAGKPTVVFSFAISIVAITVAIPASSSSRTSPSSSPRPLPPGQPPGLPRQHSLALLHTDEIPDEIPKRRRCRLHVNIRPSNHRRVFFFAPLPIPGVVIVEVLVAIHRRVVPSISIWSAGAPPSHAGKNRRQFRGNRTSGASSPSSSRDASSAPRSHAHIGHLLVSFLLVVVAIGVVPRIPPFHRPSKRSSRHHSGGFRNVRLSVVSVVVARRIRPGIQRASPSRRKGRRRLHRLSWRMPRRWSGWAALFHVGFVVVVFSRELRAGNQVIFPLSRHFCGIVVFAAVVAVVVGTGGCRAVVEVDVHVAVGHGGGIRERRGVAA